MKHHDLPTTTQLVVMNMIATMGGTVVVRDLLEPYRRYVNEGATRPSLGMLVRRMTDEGLLTEKPESMASREEQRFGGRPRNAFSLSPEGRRLLKRAQRLLAPGD